MKGINIQGCVRGRLHRNLSYNRIIDRCAEVIKDLGVTSVRIGGTPMEGAKFDEDVPGYGYDGELVSDPYNYPIAMLDVCQAAGIKDVYISLYAMGGDNNPTNGDIIGIQQLALARGITRLRFGLDNEPYSPNRTKDGTVDYQYMAQVRGALAAQGFDSAWPLMYAASFEPLNRRNRRQGHTRKMFDSYSFDKEAFEVHLYCPPTMKPRDFLSDALMNTRQALEAYGLEDDKNIEFIVGEWSGKNQEIFDDDELEHIIREFGAVFKSRNVDNYYQLLAGGYDVHGLYNFFDDKTNRGYDTFKSL